jgi:uncharacterized protein with PQ loop repeat
MHFLGEQHKRQRKETGEKKRSPYIVFLDKMTFVIGVVGPFVVVPQIWSIFTTQSAEGVSLMTWLLMFIVTFPWVLYGLAHRDAAIITSFTLWEIANATVVVGVLLYG